MNNNNKKLLQNINEVSNLIDVKPHVLRQWDEKIKSFGINILSMKKNKDGKRRYYREEDIEILKNLKYLMYTKKYTMIGALEEIKNKSKKRTSYNLVNDLKILSKNIRKLLNN